MNPQLKYTLQYFWTWTIKTFVLRKRFLKDNKKNSICTHFLSLPLSFFLSAPSSLPSSSSLH